MKNYCKTIPCAIMFVQTLEKSKTCKPIFRKGKGKLGKRVRFFSLANSDARIILSKTAFIPALKPSIGSFKSV